MTVTAPKQPSETQPLLRDAEHNDRFRRLGWVRLTVISIVEAIALGALGLPSAFATLGMFAGIVLTVGMGLIAMYAAYNVGQVKFRYPEVKHYADVGRLLMGGFGANIFVGSFVALLIFVAGSHCLTGAIAFRNITQTDSCTVIYSAVAAVLLMLFAIPPSFAEVAILGYVDFVSIILAIGVTMVATGIQSGGVSDWSAWPMPGTTFSSALVAANNIVFAYSFAGCLPSFMEDMHTPEDYVKTMWWLGGIQIVVYTLTGAVIYAFVGQSVQSPALLSAGPVVSRVVFAIALPVIFISGSINTTVVCRYIHDQLHQESIDHHISTARGWSRWLALVSGVTLIAWVIAEAIPVFSNLLSISSSLFISGLSFYLPPVMWYFLLREGEWYERQNWKPVVLNGIVFLVGVAVFAFGTYASLVELILKFTSGAIGRPFSCSI
ncbi:hypothetical protein N7470_000805 [Penicillium chermesinum]|nr:hypothetical protein N7470_000805 [Penicillium chermesinum]